MINKWIKQKNKNHSETNTCKLGKESIKVMKEDDILCIAQAFPGDHSRKYATYVYEYLAMSNLPISTIIRAQIIEPYQLEIEDTNNNIYILST